MENLRFLLLAAMTLLAVAVGPVAGAGLGLPATSAPEADCGGPYTVAGWSHHGMTELTVTPTANGSDTPVANATVYVDGEKVGTTNSDGEVKFISPSEFEYQVVVVKGNHASVVDVSFTPWQVTPVEACQQDAE